MADAAFYYLNSSVHPSSPASTSIFGLATWTNYHYYYGHVMWDLELSRCRCSRWSSRLPQRLCCDYRFRNLGAAADQNARLLGWRGSQFPWESAASTGQEAAPLPGTAAWHEDHVSLDVALAFAFHADATNDPEFLPERAWPVLSGVAEWLECASTKDRTRLRDPALDGHRRAPTDLRNAAFTNMAARLVLRKAGRVGRALGRRSGTVARDGRRLGPAGAGRAIVPTTTTSVDEEKGATPDPLMGIFPLEAGLTPEQEQATLDSYLGMADAYVGSPMLSALYGVWAARAGDRKLAAKLLDQGYAAFMADRFLQTLEYRRDRFPEQPMAGPFFANLGGFLMGLILGFPGIAVDEGEVAGWPRRPVVLPAG